MGEAALKPSYLTRKTIDTVTSAWPSLTRRTFRRSLGPVSLTALGVGAIIGAGIFVLTGAAAARYAGPAVVLSFALAGFACAIVALCYAELAALIPVSGSTYSYVYIALGEIFAWIIGWDLVLEYAMGAATVAVGWSGYLMSLLASLGLHLPPQFTARWESRGVSMRRRRRWCWRSPACSCSAPRIRARQQLMVGFKLAVVLVVIVVGGLHVVPAHWSPFLPGKRRTNSAISAGAAFCAARRWCFSPISALTRFRRRRRRRTTRGAPCRSA